MFHQTILFDITIWVITELIRPNTFFVRFILSLNLVGDFPFYYYYYIFFEQRVF